jgi:hypothetical protein
VIWGASVMKRPLALIARGGRVLSDWRLRRKA